MNFEEGKTYRVKKTRMYSVEKCGIEKRMVALGLFDYVKYHDGCLLLKDGFTISKADMYDENFIEVPTKKMYLSFPITGRKADERREYARQMIDEIANLMPWFEVVNPLDNKLEYDVHWSKHMKADIAMLLECDAIFMCKDWQWSHGCKLEHDIATSCGLDVVYEESHWYAPIM